MVPVFRVSGWRANAFTKWSMPPTGSISEACHMISVSRKMKSFHRSERRISSSATGLSGTSGLLPTPCERSKPPRPDWFL